MMYFFEMCILIKYDIFLVEVVMNYFDDMKSRFRGYVSMEYVITGYRQSDFVCLDVLIN